MWKRWPPSSFKGHEKPEKVVEFENVEMLKLHLNFGKVKEIFNTDWNRDKSS